MSVFRDLEITCRACGAVGRHQVAESINAATRKDLRQQILDDTFQRVACPGCGQRVVVDGPMLFIDFEREQWFELFPAPWERAWRTHEAESLRRFRHTVVEYAPPMIQARADDLVVRTVFGIDALREKLVAFDAGIDDHALEAVKLDALRTEPGLIGNPRVRIRLRTVEPDALQFAVHDGREPVGELTAPRARLDAAAGDDWLTTRALLAGAYVDVGRLLVDDTAR